MSQPEPRFPIEAWQTVFSTIPAYPDDLPDEIVRELAQLAIVVREAGAMLTDGLNNDNLLLTLMPLSLISSSLKRLKELAVPSETGARR